MARGAWRSTAHGSQRIRHNWATDTYTLRGIISTAPSTSEEALRGPGRHQIHRSLGRGWSQGFGLRQARVQLSSILWPRAGHWILWAFVFSCVEQGWSFLLMTRWGYNELTCEILSHRDFLTGRVQNVFVLFGKHQVSPQTLVSLPSPQNINAYFTSPLTSMDAPSASPPSSNHWPPNSVATFCSCCTIIYWHLLGFFFKDFLFIDSID